jgi:hypothetical protein
MKKNYSYLKLAIYLILLVIINFLLDGVVSAEHCLDTWLLDNSRNMAVNPGFEEIVTDQYGNVVDLSGWRDPFDTTNYPYGDKAGYTTEIDEVNIHSGISAVKVSWHGEMPGIDPNADQNYYAVYQDFNVIPGRTYRVTGYIKTENIYCDNTDVASWNGVRILVYDPDNPYNTERYWSSTTESLYGTNDWTKVSTEFTIPDYSSRLRIVLRRFVGWQSGHSYGSAWWDDIQLLPVPIIYDLNTSADQITIKGESFGDDPGAGNRNSQENCVLYNGVCLPDSLVLSWSDSAIVIVNTGDGVINVKSGGIVSNSMIVQPHATLSNNTITIHFPNIINGEGIDQITDNSTGRQFIDDASAVQPLYEFIVKETPFTTAKTVISSKDASLITRTFSDENGIQTLTVTANHCDEFTVTATVALPSIQGEAKFSISIQNHGNQVIQSVRYPIIAAKPLLGSDSTDDAIVIPHFEGYLYKNPGSLAATTSYKDRDYPGQMTLQMLAYYDEEQPGAGLYMASNDNEGYKKRFGFERVNKNGDNYILFSFLHVTSEEAGNNLTVPYEVLVDTFTGNWYDAADKYKQWALTQPWASTKVENRQDVPDFLFDIKTMIDCYSCPPEDYVLLVNHYENLLDVQDILIYPGGFWGVNDGYKEGFYYTDIYGREQPVKVSWSGIDYFTDDPVYDPSEEFNPPYSILKTAIDDLRAQYSDILLFLEGRPFWDQYLYRMSNNYPGLETCSVLDQSMVIPEELKVFDDRLHYYAYGEPYVLINEDGSEAHLFNFAFPRRPEDMADEYCRVTSTICVGNENPNNVMNLVIYNAIKRGIDHGARLMSLDGLISGKIYGCWNPDHGHPIGEGKWTHDRYVSMLNDIRDIVIAKGKYGEFGLAMEDPHELYLPYLQMQYLRHSDLSNIGNKKIPLFNYIYKEYYIGLERGMYLNSSNDIDIRWSLAIDFLQGNIQGTMVPSTIQALDDDVVAFYKRLIAMKRSDFYKGGMLHPPVFEGLPEETVITRNGRNYYIDPILTNVLKTDDFTISYLIVNAKLDGSGVYTIEFNVEQYDLPTDRVLVEIIKEGLNGREIQSFQDITLPYPVSVRIDGGEVVEVRVQVDSDGDGIPDTADCSNGDSTIYPGAVEVCDWKDNDCDGEVDEGLDSGHIDLKHAEVEWNHEGGSVHKVKIHGDVYLGCMDYSQLNAVGSVGLDISGEAVIDEPVAFTVKGGEGKKWEYKSGNTNLGINKFKIDWKGAKFDYNGNIKIKSEHIGYDTSTIEIVRKNLTSPVIVSVNNVSVTIDATGSVTVEPASVEFDADDDGEIEVELPFTLTQDTVFHVTESNNLYDIAVSDYYISAIGKFKVTGHFESQNLSGDSDPADLSIKLGVGEKGFLKSYSITESDWKELKTKEWKFKLH